jgi:hypothetical protein
MKRAIEKQIEKQKSQPSTGSANGLDKAEFNRVLDDLIRTFEDSKSRVKELLAKVKA